MGKKSGGVLGNARVFSQESNRTVLDSQELATILTAVAAAANSHLLAFVYKEVGQGNLLTPVSFPDWAMNNIVPVRIRQQPASTPGALGVPRKHLK